MAKFGITQEQVSAAHEWARSKRTEPAWMQDLAPTSKQTLIHEVTRALLMLQGSQEIPVEMTAIVRATILYSDRCVLL